MAFSHDASFATSSAVPVHHLTMEGGRWSWGLPWEETEAVNPRENSLTFLLTTGMPADPPNCTCYDLKGWLL